MKDSDKIYAERLTEEYSEKTERKVVQLKKLDDAVKSPARIFGYTFGILGALIAGTGMSFLMTDFGPSGILKYVLGILFGVVGFILCGINYPIYLKILNARKKKYAFEISKLAKEISEE